VVGAGCVGGGRGANQDGLPLVPTVGKKLWYSLLMTLQGQVHKSAKAKGPTQR